MTLHREGNDVTEMQQPLSAAAMCAAIEGNLRALYAHSQHLPSAHFHEAADRTWFGLDQTLAFFNVVLRVAFNTDTLDAQIDATLAPFRARNVPVRWWVGPSTRPTDLGTLLERHGLTHIEDAPGMAIDLDAMNDAIPAPERLIVRRVEDAETLAQFVDAYVRTFAIGAREARIWSELFARLCDPAGPFPHYVALLDGEPVATANMFLGGGAAGLYHLGTVTEARGQGVGAAITLTPLRDARASGYRIGTLQSTPMGYRIYRRVGFAEYCKLGLYQMDCVT
jgi:predicted GNAT family acetyltransferase